MKNGGHIPKISKVLSTTFDELQVYFLMSGDHIQEIDKTSFLG